MTDYFRTKKHVFRVLTNENPFGIMFKIGGLHYNDCINVTLFKAAGGQIKTEGKIIHIQSEPECGYSKLLEKGDTVDFIKASLQYIVSKYPSVKTFKLEDASYIECGRFKTYTPPRKMEKPFSLAHLSLALYGQTWYERQFGAKMIHTSDYSRYREAVKQLANPIHIDYETFKLMTQLNPVQENSIEKYYSTEKTWFELFHSIPKTDQCTVFFNWLPTFINDLLKGTYNPFIWYIDIDTMPKTNCTPTVGGSTTRRKRKRNTSVRFINNTCGYLQGGGGNGHIFDGASDLDL